MAQLTPDIVAHHFLAVLATACSQVGDRWFLVPVHNESPLPAYRERVYCYELYHQLRELTSNDPGVGAPQYTLSGEIDKSGLDSVIEDALQKPDLVWHEPGQGANAVVIEVKMVPGLKSAGIRKDLTTLSAFLDAPDGRAYERGVLLLYGPGNKDRLMRRIRVQATNPTLPCLDRINVLWHRRPGERPIDLGPINTRVS